MANPWDRPTQKAAEPASPAASGATPWQKPGEAPEYKTRTGRPSTTLAEAGGAFDDLVRVIANGATFNGADQLAAWDPLLNLTPPEQENLPAQRQLTAEAEQRLGPGVTTAASLVGGGLSSALIPGAAFSTMGRAAATGAAMGGGGTVATSYFNDGTIPDLPEVAVGTVLGAGLGAAGQKVGSLFAKPKVNPIMDKYANVLKNEGIDVLSGQVMGKAGVAQRAREAAAKGASEVVEKQADSFSSAALRKANIITTVDGRLEPQVLDKGFRTIGGQMDVLATNNPITGPNAKPILTGLYRDLYKTAKEYSDSIEGPAAKIVKNTVMKIGKAAKAGHLSGEDYQAMTSSLEGAARRNAALAPTLRELRGTIDNAMEMSLASTNPAANGAWKEARRLYSNLLVIQRAAGVAGNDAAGGLITPQALAAAVKAVKGTKAYTRGWTDFDELSRAGNAILGYKLPIPTQASSSEIAKHLARKLGIAGVGTAMGTSLGPAGMIGGAAVGAGLDTAANAVSSAMALRPYGNLSNLPLGEIGGRIGSAASAGLAGAVPQNPFAKAISQ